MTSADGLVTFLPVADIERAGGFYRDVLGLDLVVDQGVCRIYRVSTDGFLGVCEHLEGGRRDGVIVTLVTDDVDGWCAQIEERGGVLESQPEANERFGIYHAFLRDPDGNRLEIQRFDDQRWAG